MRSRAKAAAAAFLLVLLTGALAAGPAAADACPNESIRIEEGATRLPGCRAYEMVSTPDKNFGDIARVAKISADGNTVVYGGFGGEADAQGKNVVSLSLARRGADGWSHSNASPKETGFLPENWWPLAFNGDFSRSIFLSGATHSTDDQNTALDLYEVALPSGDSTLLSAYPAVPKTQSTPIIAGGVTPDLRHILFSADGPALLPDAPDFSRAVYDLEERTLHLVSILPDGTVAPAASLVASIGQRSGTDPHPGNVPPPFSAPPISDDGSRIFWTDTFNSPNGGVYVRLNGTTTRAVSRSQTSSDTTSVANAQFVAATHDGSVAYFISDAQLTDNAPAASQFQNPATLYRYDVENDSLRAVTPGPELPGVTDAVLSDDGSQLYFIASGVLAPGATQGGGNVYVWDTTTEDTRFIATIEPGSPGFSNSTNYLARISADGNWALIAATVSVDGAPTNGRAALYLYDRQTDELSCVSCRADGSPNQADAALEGAPEGAYPQGVGSWLDITEDGAVYFDSRDRLVPEDLTAAQDVYEYDHGTLSLISSGRSDYPSFLMENTYDGSSVFFLTRDRLVAQDPDTLLDLYDARVGGGFAAPAAGAAPCAGEECQGAGSAAPGPVPAGSTRVRGAGNVKPSCSRLEHRAAGMRSKARQLRRQAAKSADPVRSGRLRLKAKRMERRARGVASKAKSCARAAHRQAGASRGTGR